MTGQEEFDIAMSLPHQLTQSNSDVTSSGWKRLGKKVPFVLKTVIFNFGILNLEHYRTQLFTEH